MLLDLCADDRENARRWAVQTAVNKLLPDRRAFGEQVRAHFADVPSMISVASVYI